MIKLAHGVRPAAIARVIATFCIRRHWGPVVDSPEFHLRAGDKRRWAGYGRAACRPVLGAYRKKRTGITSVLRLVLAVATASTRRIDADIAAAVDCGSRSVRVALDYCDLAVWSDDRGLSRFAKDDIAASVNIGSL